MFDGQFVFSQLVDFLPRRDFSACVERYRGNYKCRGFSCRDQFLAMAFAQLTYRESLRDIEICLRALGPKLYHAGFRSQISRSTIADANQRRDWRIFADFAHILIRRARALYAKDVLAVDLEQTAYALDSTTIDLCLSLFRGPDSEPPKRRSSCTRCWISAATFPVLYTFHPGKCTMSTCSTVC